MGDCLGSIPGVEYLSWYVTSHPGQLSLAIPSWIGARSTNHRAVMPCGCHMWVAGKTVRSPCYTWAILECFREFLKAVAQKLCDGFC